MRYLHTFISKETLIEALKLLDEGKVLNLEKTGNSSYKAEVKLEEEKVAHVTINTDKLVTSECDDPDCKEIKYCAHKIAVYLATDADTASYYRNKYKL